MPLFAANLTMLWTELQPMDRFRAAADAGFRDVEMLFPHELDPRELERVLLQSGLQMVLFDPAAGDWKNGERGLLCLPGREEEFRSTVQSALELAERLGTRLLNALAGVPAATVQAPLVDATLEENLRWAADACARAGVTLLVENINRVDIPGYRIGTVAEAARIVESAAHPNVRLQLDQYHAGMSGEDAITAYRDHAVLIEHVQIADVPGRHQPGTGEAPIGEFLAELDRGGYSGRVGLEYRPLGPTDVSFTWMHRLPLAAD